MTRKAVLKGILLGVAVPVLVALLFVLGFGTFKNIGFDESFTHLHRAEQLANVLRIGLLANFVTFMIVVRTNEFLSRGLVIATLVLLTVSLLI